MKPDTQELALRQDSQLAVEPSTASMLQAFIAAGVTADNVGAFERLVALQERQEAKEAERAFNKAFTALQREIPTITADRKVNDKEGEEMYRYCSYVEILKQVQPLLTQHGFAVRFSQELTEGIVRVTCHLMHEAGHTASSSYSARAGTKGAPGMNETKIDLSASTSAQREAFCDALNIVRRGRDIEADDARDIGGAVTAEEAADIKRRVQALDPSEKNEKRVLKWAGGEGCAAYGQIPAKRMAAVLAWLEQKESEAQ